MRRRIAHYIPGGLAFVGVVVILRFPIVAAVILSIPLLALGFLYTAIVWKLHSIHTPGASDVSFRDISVTLRNRKFGGGGIFLGAKNESAPVIDVDAI